MNRDLWARSCGEVAGARRIDCAGASLDVVTAAMWWSIIVEPGDAALGFVDELCGRRRGLEALFLSDSAQDLCRRLQYAAASAAEQAGVEQNQSLNDSEQRVIRAAWARWAPRVDKGALRRVIATAESMRMSIIAPGPSWPAQLDDLGAHRPACLWVRGDGALLAWPQTPMTSVVGARAATGYGEHCAMEIAGGLAGCGSTVVSGGAYGIDGAAHRAALAVDGATIAVLAGGADRLYPSGHEQLLRQIIERGAVVSEAGPGTTPTRWRFLQRNRLIAALGRATIVVEAGSRSGSLNTAHHALTLGRALGAVPGPITSTSSRGCHTLIRDANAVCITSVDDARLLAGMDSEPEPLGTVAAGDDIDASTRPIHTRVVDALHPRQPRDIAELVRLTGLEPSAVMAAVGELETRQVIVARSEGWVRGRGSRAV